MPKTIFSKREDLICGKIDDLVIDIKILNITNEEKEYLISKIYDIQHDAQRMEDKLVFRKQEAEQKNKWINIKNETDLPKDYGIKYHSGWLENNVLKNYDVRSFNELYKQYKVFDSVNVYQPIIKPNIKL